MPKARLYRLGLFNFKDYPDGRLGDSDVNFKLYKDTEDYNNLPDDAVNFIRNSLLYGKVSEEMDINTEVDAYFALYDGKHDKNYNVYVSTYISRDGVLQNQYSVKEYKNGWVELPESEYEPLNQLKECLKSS